MSYASKMPQAESGDNMKFIEAEPSPKVCKECEERKACLARNEGEWCCDECDRLGERFIMIPDAPQKEAAKG